MEAFEKSLELAQLQNDRKAEKVIKKAIKDCNDKIAHDLKNNDGQGQIQSNEEQNEENVTEEKKSERGEEEQQAITDGSKYQFFFN